MSTAYETLVASFTKLYRYQHLASIVAWDQAAMMPSKGNYTNGCLQDIHWTDGAFGYFPSYTLGAMYAAQYFAAIRTQTPDLDARTAAGDLAPIFTWLEAQIWSQASRWETPRQAFTPSRVPPPPDFAR